MSCTCIKCPECNGTGYVWYSSSGDFLGSRRSDDLDEMESCPECGGDGLQSLCEECHEAMEDEE